MLQGFRHVRMAAVRISGVKELQSVVVAVQQEFGKPVDPQGRLMRMVAGAHGASSHRQSRGLDAGLPQGHRIRGRKLLCYGWQCRQTLSECPGRKPGAC
jgi:hypothetical protein